MATIKALYSEVDILGMKKELDFLLEILKLKEMPRTGWVLRKVKNPETIAEHTFRLAVISWLLAEKNKLNAKRAVKIALAHDLCEVYAGDMTPFFYYTNLPKDKKKREAMLLKWVRLSKKEREKRGKVKYEKEKESLLRLIKNVSPELKKEIFSAWYDYEKGITKEGIFVRQLDRVETLLQSIEYFGIKEKDSGTSWWEGTEELVEDPLILDFLKVIQKRFYGKVFGKYKKDPELESILDFLLEVGKLKRMPRLYWVIRKVRNPETVVGHIFTLVLMAWVFGLKKKNLHMGKLIKMALCHEMTALETGDTTPYDDLLPENEKEKIRILGKLPRLLREEKIKRFLNDYSKEEKAFSKITFKLPPVLKNEILKLWQEYRKKSSPEGKFLSQLNVLAVLIEGLLQRKQNKNLSVSALWEWAFEVCDDPITIQLTDEIKKKLHR